MRKFYYLLLTSCCFTLHAQDVITFKNGDEINAKVMDIGTAEIKYKKSENLDGPVYSVYKTAVFRIKFENGTMEVIKAPTITPVNTINKTDGYTISNDAKPSLGQSKEKESFVQENFYYDTRYPFNQVYYLNQLNEIRSLESKVVIANYVPSFGWVPPLYMWEIQDPTSNIRINANTNCSFIAKFITPAVNPSKIRLVHFTNKDKKGATLLARRRVSVMANAKLSEWSGMNKLNEFQFASEPDFIVPISVKPLGNGVFEFTTTRPLRHREGRIWVLYRRCFFLHLESIN